jgi:hypothetical protein
MVTNTADSGPGSLRQAITDANLAGGGTVAFNIPAGSRTITLSSSLPLAAAGVIIDGTTQSGYAGAPLVEISGANMPDGGTEGCVRTSGSVRGLAVNRCRYADIEGVGAPVIAANYIGLNLSGGFAPPNLHGIHLNAGSSGAIIGGNSFADANIITATNTGIWSAASNVTISHNRLGTTPSGEPYVGNLYGITVGNGSNATITFNFISATAYGVTAANMSNVTIKNVTVTRSSSSNPFAGIFLVQTNNSTIGDLAGGGNTVTEAGAGVVIVSGTNNRIRGNSISRTFSLGIDLTSRSEADGPTPNDSCDPDSGPNNLQNHPILTAVTASGGATIATGTFNGAPNESFTIDFYWDDAACNDRGGAKTYLGTTTVSTGNTCDAEFNTVFPGSLPEGASVTATATDTNGNTSELSPCATVEGTTRRRAVHH